MRVVCVNHTEALHERCKTRKPASTLSEKTARKIERALSLAQGWFDTNQDHTPSTVEEDLLKSVIRAVAKELPASDKLAEVILLVYEDARKNGLQPEFVKRVAALVR